MWRVEEVRVRFIELQLINTIILWMCIEILALEAGDFDEGGLEGFVSAESR